MKMAIGRERENQAMRLLRSTEDIKWQGANYIGLRFGYHDTGCIAWMV